ncbi:MAG: carbamate kinase [Culicoidibacterales bacterium]
MGKQRIVVALGGNALGNTPSEQKQLVKQTAQSIVALSKKYDVVVAHGNGPQVGMIQLTFDEANKQSLIAETMPLPECGAMSQGYIGYHLTQAINNECMKQGENKQVATLLTQVEVDLDDAAFSNPTKPVGSFYTKEEAEILAQQNNEKFVEDSGRGYRRVVASPLPRKIIEKDMIENLIQQGAIVIACGGGGIPVVKKETGYEGIAAVIDKDRTSSCLAANVQADKLVILTAVEQVALRFGTPDVQWVSEMTVSEAKQYIQEGHFAAGSMLPKVEACIEYVETTGKVALITSLEAADRALENKTGTRIIPNE